MNPLTILPTVIANHKYSFSRTIASSICSILFFCAAVEISYGQKKIAPADSVSYLHQIAFIADGPELLTKAIEHNDWLQVRNFIENWKRSGSPSEELIFCISELLDIQEKKFSVYNFPCEYISLLENYKRELIEADDQAQKFRYEIWLDCDNWYDLYWYDATKPAKEWLNLIRAWSEYLTHAMRLTRTELLFCEIIAGKVEDPAKEIQLASRTYPDLQLLDRDQSRGQMAYQIYQRNRHVGTAGIMAGVWFPTGNLSILGVHPSLGFYFGGRTRKNEYDLIFSFRFLNSAVDHYKVSTNDSSYYNYHFDGGYIGFDYSRYFISKTKYEVGFTTAIAYDYFNIVNAGSDNQANPSFHSIDIASFDFSNGIRIKYFLGPKSFLGLFLKYHLVNYCNTGGTDFGGNAFTMDLVYGSH